MARHPRLGLLLVAMAIPLLPLAPALGARAARLAAHAHDTKYDTIQNFASSPKSLTVAPGTTVIWTNKDNVDYTVTSDTGAWPDSGSLATNKFFSRTFSKADTFPYHRANHPFMKASVLVSSSGTRGGPMTGGGMMGPMSTTPLTSFTGWYDNHKVVFLATDTSSKTEAMSEHINYSASVAKTLSSSDKIYIIMNGKYANRGPVFASEPGEDTYTPLWQEVFVTWTAPSKAVALGKDDQINDLAKKGMLTLKMTKTVLNCPIIKVISGST
jgi:plastocyanin